jgi:hypothetical protein
MSSALSDVDLHGVWSGTKKLWLAPDDPAFESRTMARVSELAQGQFVSIAYQWTFDDQPQDGLIVFISEFDRSLAKAIWLDSWHMKNAIMICESSGVDDGAVSFLGSYLAPPGPDWGWRIEFKLPAHTELMIRMTNISPDHEESLAVLAQYKPRTEASQQ